MQVSVCKTIFSFYSAEPLLHLAVFMVYWGCFIFSSKGDAAMKKKTRWILCGLLAAAAIVGGVCFWQCNNLRALRMSMQLSQDELIEKMDEQQARTEEVSRKTGVAVRPLTDEEKAALQQSELTRQELIDRLAGSAERVPPEEQPLTDAQPAAEEHTAEDMPADSAPVSGAPAELASPSSAPADAPQPEPGSDAPLREALAKCIAELYVMEAEYTAWLEQANQGAIDDFVALPEEEQTTSAKYSIGMQYLAAALEKEKECDARMQTLEDQIRSLLTQLGEDTALVDEIHTTYMDEKAAKKAYYLSLH